METDKSMVIECRTHNMGFAAMLVEEYILIAPFAYQP